MADFFDIIDVNNKIKYDNLVDFISNNRMTDFFTASKHPYLVGKELYDGQMNKREGMTNTSTMMFKAADLRREIQSLESSNTVVSSNPGISKSLYVLNKSNDSYDRTPNEISVGRASFNDITIADYVISKKQAIITLFFDKYFITDLNSTNGTTVNGARIEPGEKIQIEKNAVIAFGRYSFIFTHAMDLYQRVKESE